MKNEWREKGSYLDICNKETLTNKKAVCKACGKTLQTMASRMQKHKSSCKNVPEETNTIIHNLSGSSEDEEEVPLAAIKRKITNSSQDESTREGELLKIDIVN